MKKLFCIIGILITIIVSGCATPGMVMKNNNNNLLALEMGMSKQEVISIMGKPTLNEAYKSLYDKPVTILFYYTQRKKGDGNRTKDECTPVVFENDELVGWGNEFYKAKMELDITIKHKIVIDTVAFRDNFFGSFQNSVSRLGPQNLPQRQRK